MTQATGSGRTSSLVRLHCIRRTKLLGANNSETEEIRQDGFFRLLRAAGHRRLVAGRLRQLGLTASQPADTIHTHKDNRENTMTKTQEQLRQEGLRAARNMVRKFKAREKAKA